MTCRPVLVFVASILLALPAAAQIAKSGAGTIDDIQITGDRDVPMAMVVLPWLEPAVAQPPAYFQSGLPRVFEHDRSLAHDPLNRSVAVLQMAKQEAVEQAQVLEAEREAASKKRRRRSRDGDAD
ncbi:MAG TPA: hypothetical protein VIS73_10150 [Rhodocyclaceae bacterium]